MKNQNKIAPSFWSLFKIYIPIYLISVVVFYLIIGVVWPPKLMHYLLLGGWTIVTIIYLVLAYNKTHYELTKHEIVHYKGGAILYYPFKDIIYIDTNYSTKKGSIRFVTNKGDERFLLHDRKRLVYKEMVERCTNLRSKNDINRQFPKLKL